MQNWSNNFHIPDQFFDSIRSSTDDYVRDADVFVSASELNNPPHMIALKRKFPKAIQTDAADLWRAYVGKALHYYTEKQTEKNDENALLEQRFNAMIGEKKISGQVDYIKDGLLVDYKSQSVFAYANLKKGNDTNIQNWTDQLNIYAYLCHLNQITINKLQIVILFLEWDKRKATSQSYPPSPVIPIDIKLEDFQLTHAKIVHRIKLIELALDGKTVECTPTERWERDNGERIRCESYCNIRSKCQAWQEYQNKK